MSSDDRWVRRLSNEQVKAHAQKSKEYFGIDRTRPVNILKCLRHGSIMTVNGLKDLIYRVVPDLKMAGSDASTELVDDAVVVSVRQSVDEKARWGDGRPRMTLAHELGHAVLHPGSVQFRRAAAEGIADDGRIPANQSAEHQAKIFAITFLVHEQQAAEMQSAEEISEQFGISFQAANILFQSIIDKRDRIINSEKINQIARIFKESIERKKFSEPNYISDLCTCGAQKLIPIGIKYLCHDCGRISDRFQDGDQQS